MSNKKETKNGGLLSKWFNKVHQDIMNAAEKTLDPDGKEMERYQRDLEKKNRKKYPELFAKVDQESKYDRYR